MVDISNYKLLLMKDILGTHEIVEAIDSTDRRYNAEDPFSLIYVNIFPYLRVPEVETETDTYILMAVNMIGANRQNKFFSDVEIRFWVMAHQNRMEFNPPTGEPATRIDYISRELLRLFEGQSKFGVSQIKMISDHERILSDKYQYRDIVFRGVDMREQVCD